MWGILVDSGRGFFLFWDVFCVYEWITRVLKNQLYQKNKITEFMVLRGKNHFSTRHAQVRGISRNKGEQRVGKGFVCSLLRLA